jgi:hypothetical protein
VSRHNPLVTPPTPLTLSAVASPEVTARRCGRCANPLPAGARSDALWCSGACRVAALRARRAGRPVAAIPPAVGRISRVDDRAQNRRSLRARAEPRPFAASLAVVPAVDDHEHSPRLMARRRRVRDQLPTRARDPGGLARRSPTRRPDPLPLAGLVRRSAERLVGPLVPRDPRRAAPRAGRVGVIAWRLLGCLAEVASFLVILAAILAVVLLVDAITTPSPS